jgi:hypothetical protein
VDLVLAEAATTASIAVIVGVFSLLTISIPLIFAERAKNQGWKRDDIVAARVEKVAVRAETAAVHVSEVADEAAFQAKSQGAKLDQIHALVNSNVTELKEAQLVSLKEIRTLKRANGIEDDQVAEAVIETLEKELAYRARVTEAADSARAATERTRVDDRPEEET